MRKIVSKFFWPIIEVLIASFFVFFVMPKNDEEKLVFVTNNDSIKMVDTNSNFFVAEDLIDNSNIVLENDVIIEESFDEEQYVEENTSSLENKQEPVKEENKEEVKQEIEEKEEIIEPDLSEEDVFSYPVISTYKDMVMTGYGPDCRGCTTGLTASGYNVSETIYYEDETFGTLRIVAADRSIPLYSVVRLSNIKGMDPVLAIVLDRGGGIGFDKSIQFDLLFESEAIANASVGKKYNITCELLRSGK